MHQQCVNDYHRKIEPCGNRMPWTFSFSPEPVEQHSHREKDRRRGPIAPVIKDEAAVNHRYGRRQESENEPIDAEIKPGHLSALTPRINGKSNPSNQRKSPQMRHVHNEAMRMQVPGS